MVPAVVVDPTPRTLIPLLESDDVVIDGPFRSRGEADFADLARSALRDEEFGGHEKAAPEKRPA